MESVSKKFSTQGGLAAGWKETEIGPIPEEWDILSLKEVLSEKGYIRGPFGSSLRRAELKNEGIPVYEQQNAIYNHRDFRFFIDKDKHKELLRFTVRPNDLVISCSGTIGRTTIISKNDPVGIISQALLILRPNTKRIDPIFFKYFFTSKVGQHSITSRSMGSVQVNIANREIIESIKMAVPSNLTEQTRIAEILSSLDDKIELNRRMNKTLEEMASALFKRWFVDFEFPDENGKPYKSSGGKMVESEMGEVPEGWRAGCLGDVIKNFDSQRVPLSNRERVKKQGVFPYYGATSIMDYVNEYIFDGEFLLVGEDGSVAKEDGKPFTQFVTGKIWVNNHAHVLQGVNGFSTEFIKIFLDRIDITPFVTGAVQPKLNQANMNSIPILIPNKEVLKRFNEIAASFFRIILANEKENSNLSKIRDSLLPRLMSGKIRV